MIESGEVIDGYLPARAQRLAARASKHRSAVLWVLTMIKVAKLKWRGEYRLAFWFSDGSTGEHDFSALVAETGPMVQPLRDPAFFGQAFLVDGAPTWPNGYDMAPRWVQMELEAAGELRRDAA